MDHSSYSGIEVIRDLRKRRKNPMLFFPIIFTSSIGLIKNDGMVGKVNNNGISQTPQAFLDCQVMDNEEGLFINWDIRNGIFEEGVIQDIFCTFLTYLKKISESVEFWNQQANVELPEKQMDQRKNVNSTFKEIKMDTLQNLFLKSALEMPKKTAVVDECGEHTYEELLWTAYGIADELQKCSCKAGDYVGIKLNKSFFQIASVLGTLLIGAAFVPIDNDQPEIRADKILEIAKIKCLIGEKEETHKYREKYKWIDKDSVILKKSYDEIVNDNFDDVASENVRTDDFRIIEKTAKDTVYIFFHTALGTTNCYRFVEKELRKEDLGDFLFINVEDVEWYYSIQYHELVDRITDEYVRKIEQLHYKNINLIGYCLGGILALNVAVKLLEKGIEVNNLFVIDSYPVSGKVEDEFIDEVIFLPNYQLMLSEVLEDVDDFKVMEFITEVRKRNNGNIPQNTFFNIIEKDSKMKNNSGLWEFVNSTKEKRFEAYAKAIEKKTCINVSAELLEATFEIYQHGFKGANVELPFYSGDICYLSACEEQKYFFADKNQNLEMWNDICLGEFEVINVPGNHVTCIHSEENATLLAQIIIERNIRG